MSEREEFIALLGKQELRKGDVIFVMQGDGLFRAPHAVELYTKGLAPQVAIVGSANDRSYGSFPSSEVRDEMIRLGMERDSIHFEDSAPHTKAEAERAIALAKERGWKTILIVTSPHHQYRAFLTFLKSMRDAGLDLSLVNAVAPLSWDDPTSWGTRREWLPKEFDKIAKYQENGDVASWEEGAQYLQKI